MATEITLGMSQETIVKLRDELTKAIDANPDGRDGGTEVTMYGDIGGRGTVLVIGNDDMEASDHPEGIIYAEVE